MSRKGKDLFEESFNHKAALKEIIPTGPAAGSSTEQEQFTEKETDSEKKQITETKTEQLFEQEKKQESDTKTEPEQEQVTKLDTKTKVVHEKVSDQGIASGFVKQFSEKKKVESTHTRDTYLIENDLLQRLNKIAKKQPKGFKMRLINHLLRQALDEIEN